MAASRSRQWQRTLSRSIELAGIGLHSGARVRMRVHPAAANTGVVFRTHQQSHEIRAHISRVDDRRSQLCTQLTSADGRASVATIEHLMAALTAARVSNAYVDVDAVAEASSAEETSVVELPILDGSSLHFLDAIEEAGVQEQAGSDATRLRCCKVKRPVQVLLGDKAAWLLPMPQQLGEASVCMPTLSMSVQVNFEHKGLGTTFTRFVLSDDPNANAKAFRDEIAPARTFTFEEEIAWMRAHGLALGGSLDNAVVFTETSAASGSSALQAALPVDERVLNPDGLRFREDEWSRHKMLDCVGDVGLAGLPIHGYFFATSPGHALTHKLLRELFRDDANYEEVAL